MFGVHLTVRVHCGLTTNLRLLGMFNQRQCFSLSHDYWIKGKYRFHGFVKLVYVDDKRFILFLWMFDQSFKDIDTKDLSILAVLSSKTKEM